MVHKKYVLVTGASSGLGNATVYELSAKGHTVFAGVRTEKDKSVFGGNPNIIPIILDVSKPENIKSATETISQNVNANGLYALINNAGVNYISAFEMADEQKERQLFEVNLFGAMALIRNILPLLHQFVATNKSNAKIINVSSIGGTFGLPWEASYHASKFAMLGFSQSLHYELEALNISVCCFLPGGMKTNIFQKSVAETQTNKALLHSSYYLRNTEHMKGVMRKFEKSATTPQKASKAIFVLLQKDKMPYKKYFGTDASFIRIINWLGLVGLIKGQFIKK